MKLLRYWFLSKYDGTCPNCRKPYKAGDRIAWFPHDRKARHSYCCPKGSKDAVPRHKPHPMTEAEEEAASLEGFVPLASLDHLTSQRAEKPPSETERKPLRRIHSKDFGQPF